MHVEHPQKTLRFLDGFAFRHSASDSFPSLQLLDRLCSDITHISISMYVSPLPSLDICHDHWTLARQATWQHLFTGLPTIIYCTSIGKHLWAASLDTAHSLCTKVHDVCSPKYKRRVQRNMKCGHPSTTEASLSSNFYTCLPRGLPRFRDHSFSFRKRFCVLPRTWVSLLRAQLSLIPYSFLTWIFFDVAHMYRTIYNYIYNCTYNNNIHIDIYIYIHTRFSLHVYAYGPKTGPAFLHFFAL